MEIGTNCQPQSSGQSMEIYKIQYTCSSLIYLYKAALWVKSKIIIAKKSDI